MENIKGNRDALRIQSYKPGDIWCEDYKLKRDTSRSHFYVPVFEFPEIEERVLNEDWNIRDVLYDGKYRTFVEANVDVYAKIIKAVQPDGKYVWISATDWQCDSSYKDAKISEIMLKPYFYVDESKRNMIAGQLKFMELKVDGPVSSDTSKEPKLTDSAYSVKSAVTYSRPVSIVDTDTIVTPSQLVDIIKALGYSPKDTINILLNEV